MRKFLTAAATAAFAFIGYQSVETIAPNSLPVLVSSAHAACTIPYTFQDFSPATGVPQPIFAGQLNANFSALTTCVGAITGPPSSTVNEFVIWNSTTGQVIQNGVDVPITHTRNFPGSFGSFPDNSVIYNYGTTWPIQTQIPAGVPQNVVSMMTVPPSYTQAPWPATNFSGYCDNQNTSGVGNSCVPYFSVGLANGGSQTVAYGANYILSNGTKTTYFTGPGKDFGALFGAEGDFNVFKVGGVNPLGHIEGYNATLAGDGTPAGGSQAFDARNLGSGTGWTYSFSSEDGAASSGAMLVGATAIAAANLDSQSINFRTYNASALEKTATIKAGHDANSVDLNLIANDPNGRVAMQVNAVTQYYVDGVGFHGTSAALSTNATGPFIYTNAMAGTPTGIPTSNAAGATAIVNDTTNHKLCWFEQPAGLWKCAAGT